MRIIIDGTIYLSAPRGGVYLYLNELIPRLSRRGNVDVRVMSPRNAPSAPPETSQVKIQKAILPSASWFPEGSVKRLLSKTRREMEAQVWKLRYGILGKTIFHSPYYSVPPSENLVLVSTVHDMVTELFHDKLTTPSHDELRRMKAACLMRTKHFIAVSENTKRDLIRLTGVSPESVSVVHHGVDFDFFSRPPTAEEERAVRTKFSLTAPYLLHVSGRLHHKNFLRLLEAYATSSLRNTHKLVAAGEDWDESELALMKKLGVRDKVILAHIPTENELRLIYQFSSFLAYPSYYEGFGLPILEAMAAGTPVAAANAASLPEVAGDAATYFDPFDPSDMARVMETLTNPTKSADLRRRGREHARKFTWDAAAEKTVAAYEKALR